MNKITLFLFLIISSFAISQKNKIEKLEYVYKVDSLFSTNTQDFRTIKIFLPKGYSEKEKYPVIYTLDGEWMFDPTVATSKILMDFDVIPKSIVIGIFHKNRNDDLGIDWNTGIFNANSLNFYKYLIQELVPQINSKYATSGFNVLLGHSNSATFCEKVLTQKEQPFNGFVALSQNLFGKQLQEYVEFTKQTFKKPVFYFVASGKRDATPRLASGMKLDSLFNINKNPNIKPKHILYDADHSGIAGKGLNNGISHIFSEYKHYNDWNDNLIDSLHANSISALDFINQHSEKMKNIYGIPFKVNQDDLSFIQAMTQDIADIEAVQNYEIAHFGKSKEFYATYAQFYEYVKSYEKALEYWNINLKENYKDQTSFFYYRRPIQLLFKKMNQPEKAIVFAEKWKKIAPEFLSDFNLWIAKIAMESNIKRKTGLKAIRVYIENSTEISPTELKKAKEIEQKLIQHNK